MSPNAQFLQREREVRSYALMARRASLKGDKRMSRYFARRYTDLLAAKRRANNGS